MAMIEVNWKPGNRELRQFAGMWLVFFGLIGGYLYYAHGSSGWSTGLMTAAVVVGVPGLLLPAIMRPIYVVWMIAAFPIGWTISHLLLGAIFYLLVTPIGLLVRATGYDPMNRKLDRDAKSYWSEHRTGTDTARYFRQY